MDTHRLKARRPDTRFWTDLEGVLAVAKDSESVETFTLDWSDELREGEFIQSVEVSANGIQHVTDPVENNLLLQANAFSTNAWDLLDSGDSFTSEFDDPFGGDESGQTLIGDSTNGPHGVKQTVKIAESEAGTLNLSVYARALDEDWIYLSNDSVSGANAYFDVANGAVGTVGAAASAAIAEAPVAGWHRCSIEFVAPAGDNVLRVAGAEADGDASYSGFIEDVRLYGAQLGWILSDVAITTSKRKVETSTRHEITGSGGVLEVKPTTTKGRTLVRRIRFVNREDPGRRRYERWRY